MCQMSQGGAQSPIGGPNGTMSGDGTSWMGGGSPSILNKMPSSGTPWQQRLMKGMQGAQRGMQMGQQMQNMMSPQRGFSYRPQMLSSQDYTQGPLSGGMMDNYLRNQLGSQGITY